MMFVWRFNKFNSPIGGTCCRILFALIFVSAPLVIPALIDTSHSLSFKHHFRLLCAWATDRSRFRILRKDHDTRYASPEEEDRYWARALLAQKWLESSDARVKTEAKMLTKIPLIRSYMPALLPLYRAPHARRLTDEGEYYISARTFCKWHRMVFPGPVHPTLQQASKLRRNFGNRELREMFRISRMVSDGVVFGRWYKWTPKYRDLWRQRRTDRQADMVVVFV